MKLYELDRGDKFTLAGDDNSPIMTFDHVDGMYSVCYIGDKLIHIGAFAPVLRVYNNNNDTTLDNKTRPRDIQE